MATYIAVILVILLTSAYLYMVKMPGHSFHGEQPPPLALESALAPLLQKDITELATNIGIRNSSSYENLIKASDYIEKRFSQFGLTVERQVFVGEQRKFCNLIAEIPGKQHHDEILIVGAHYDSVDLSPAANDNASGIAALLALAQSFALQKPARTLRFTAFVNEELPFYQTPLMGSWAYSKRCRERKENIVGMFSLETIGYYSDEEGSQRYPFPLAYLYPSQGNYIAFVSNLASAKLLRSALSTFRNTTKFPSEGAALPEWVPGVAWSDQWAFWKEGYSAVMLTDTAPFRYPYYHTKDDTPDKINYMRLARVTLGIQKVVETLINE